MGIRNFVTFDAEFPDDSQWDEQGNLLIPGGKNIAEFFRRQLQEKGFSCSDTSQHSHYGWAFDAVSEKIQVWCLLQTYDTWLLILEQKKSIVHRLFGSHNNSSFDVFQDKIQEILTMDRRFSKVLWYTRGDFESGKVQCGSPMPR